MLFGPTCKSITAFRCLKYLRSCILLRPANFTSLPTAASMTANQSQVFTQAFDYYLGDGAKYIPELYALSKANTKEADDKILR